MWHAEGDARLCVTLQHTGGCEAAPVSIALLGLLPCSLVAGVAKQSINITGQVVKLGAQVREWQGSAQCASSLKSFIVFLSKNGVHAAAVALLTLNVCKPQVITWP